jgi:hypothetical protein
VILAAEGIAGAAYATGGGFIAFSCSVFEVLNVSDQKSVFLAVDAQIKRVELTSTEVWSGAAEPRIRYLNLLRTPGTRVRQAGTLRYVNPKSVQIFWTRGSSPSASQNGQFLSPMSIGSFVS